MNKFVITTDNTTDFPKEYIEAHGIKIIDLTYSIDGGRQYEMSLLWF